MIPSPSLQWKFKLLVGKSTWGNKAKHCWVMSTNFLVFKSLLTIPSNVLSSHLKQTFPPIIWIFTQDEGDWIESRLSPWIFYTLSYIFVPTWYKYVPSGLCITLLKLEIGTKCHLNFQDEWGISCLSKLHECVKNEYVSTK